MKRSRRRTTALKMKRTNISTIRRAGLASSNSRLSDFPASYLLSKRKKMRSRKKKRPPLAPDGNRSSRRSAGKAVGDEKESRKTRTRNQVVHLDAKERHARRSPVKQGKRLR